MKKVSLTALMLAGVLALSACSAAKTYEKTNLKKYVTLGEYKGISYTATSTEVTDFDVQVALNKALSGAGYGTASTDTLTEGTVQVGDTVNIDYAGYKGGVAFEGGTATGQSLKIGSSSFIAGFEEGLVGAAVGSELDLNLTFPENYNSEELQGAAVVFHVKVNSITARNVYPELTDALAKELDSSVSTAEEYKTKERDTLKTSKETDAASTDKSTVWSQVLSGCTFADKLPAPLLKSAQETFTNYYTSYASKSGYSDLASWLSANNLTQDTFDTKAASYAESVVKSQLVAYSIAKAEGYQVTDEELTEKATNFATSAGYSSVDDYINSIGKESIKDQIVLDYATNLAMENAVAKS